MKTLERMDGKLFKSLQSKEMANLASIVGGGQIVTLTTQHVVYMIDMDNKLQRIAAGDKQDWEFTDQWRKVGPEYQRLSVPADQIVREEITYSEPSATAM